MQYLISVLVSLFTMVFTVSMTNHRIESDDSEQHKPYMVLDNVTTKDKLDIFRYYLTFIGKNYYSDNPDAPAEELVEKEKNYSTINIILKNIGYGVATNIKFYDLLTGKEVIGTQAESKDANQKLFTTLDCAANEEKTIQVKLLYKLNNNEPEHNRILCVYKDLNEHIYTFIFCVNVKDTKYYDFFAYQPSSHSYQKYYKECKKQHHEIINKYREL